MALRCVCLSDFNVANLAGFLADLAQPPALQLIPTEYGQVLPLLLDPSAACWREKPDVTVIWTRAEAIAPSFARLLRREMSDPAALLAEVDSFADAVVGVAGRSAAVLVPTWTIPANDRGLGLLDLHPEIGIRGALRRMNARLAERLAPAKSTFLLEADRWLSLTRRPGFNPKLWYMAKVAFDNEVLRLAAQDIKAAVRAVRGEARKLVLLDLDGTLWGGIVGDIGWESLVLGGHDPAGEAYVEFQHRLKALTRQGVLLGIVSKNEESVALDAIDQHPEMVLRRGDFAGWRINWGDKAQNIVDLTAELNLGLQSVVFLDDNPVERDRIRQAIPEVLVPDWPADVLRYPLALVELSCFDVATLSREDRERTALYQQEQQRQVEAQRIGSFDEWLQSLNMVISIEPLAAANLPRATQLLNKTNQMNLTTRRLSDADLWSWSQQSGHRCWTLRVDDRFGSSGLCGFLSVAQEDHQLRIVDLVLSCRVFGRKVEETMLSTAVAWARGRNLATVFAVYLPTPKNKPTLGFLLRSGFVSDPKASAFQWDASQEYPVPTQVTVNQSNQDSSDLRPSPGIAKAAPA